jgi:Icc-related predicted phosphoesterase
MIRLVADVHGAVDALAQVAARQGKLIVLGDLINFIDYRTNEGIVSEVSGPELVQAVVGLRMAGDFEAAAALWRQHAAGREAELRAKYDELVDEAYREICAALEGCEAYVTYGNVDRPDLLKERLPASARFVDAEKIELDGTVFGFAGGGTLALGTPGEVADEEMEAKLASLGPVDVLCTHVPPALDALADDVIGGRQKGSLPVLDYLWSQQPRLHYFGDIHQPQATTWRVGATTCHNVGYFRATGRAVTHG